MVTRRQVRVEKSFERERGDRNGREAAKKIVAQKKREAERRRGQRRQYDTKEMCTHGDRARGEEQEGWRGGGRNWDWD